MSFQLLASEFRYWFDGDDVVVAYVDTGTAWVAGGPPIAPLERLDEVAARFAEAAAVAGRRVSFFACEQRFVDAMRAHRDDVLPRDDLRRRARVLQIGEQPVWSPAGWDDVLAHTSSLRYQLRRARAKGVRVRAITVEELATDPSLRTRIEALCADWLASRRMAPMGFLVALEPLAFGAARVILVAEQHGVLVGVMSAVPVYARQRLSIEHLIRARAAPNGTTELLVDATMRIAAARGAAGVTLGLAPLAGMVTAPLRFARAISRPLYDFRGLRAFKNKLRPSTWEAVYLLAPRSRWVGLLDGLRAFARGDLVGFAGATIERRREFRFAVLALVLVLIVAALWAA